jgi:polysaccharide deacetylase 2 family uncharacterized protein YibQ
MPAAHKKRFDRKILLIGYGIIVVALAGLAAWLIKSGPPPQPVIAAITVPIEVQPAAAPPSSPLPVPPKVPTGMDAALPFNTADTRPRIAIVITELGPSVSTAESAIRHLPPEVTLSFLTFAPDVGDLVNEARAGGHEVLLDIPMEPATYPEDDPGVGALMTTASDSENLRRLDSDLARAQGYVGIVNFMGSRFTSAQEKLQPVFTMLQTRNLLVVDTRANALTAMPSLAVQMKVPFAVADVTIDGEPSREAIDKNLDQLEAIAKAKGKALGIAGAYPVSLERIAEWSKSLAAKGIALAPVSAIATMPK